MIREEALDITLDQQSCDKSLPPIEISNETIEKLVMEQVNIRFRDMNNIDYLRGAKLAFSLVIDTLIKNEDYLSSNGLINQVLFASTMTIKDIDKQIESIIENMEQEVQRNK